MKRTIVLAIALIGISAQAGQSYVCEVMTGPGVKTYALEHHGDGYHVSIEGFSRNKYEATYVVSAGQAGNGFGQVIEKNLSKLIDYSTHKDMPAKLKIQFKFSGTAQPGKSNVSEISLLGFGPKLGQAAVKFNTQSNCKAL